MANVPVKDDSTFQPWTYADYKAWDIKQGERYEIIYGKAYVMSAPSVYHQAMLMELSRQFANFLFGRSGKVFPAPFNIRLFYKEDESDDTIIQPDLTVICDKNKLGEEGGRGVPDLIVEILLPSNTAIEMQRKFNLFRDAGVREYWVVDGEHKEITVYLFDKNQSISQTYGEKSTVPVTVLTGLSIELEPVFAAE